MIDMRRETCQEEAGERLSAPESSKRYQKPVGFDEMVCIINEARWSDKGQEHLQLS